MTMPAVPNTDRRTSSYSFVESSQTSILELILLRVRLRARRRAAWLAHLSGGSMSGPTGSLEAVLNASLDDRDAPASEAAWFESREHTGAVNDALDKV